MLTFTNILEEQVTDPQTNIAALLPLLRRYIASPDEELRRYALLTVSQLARWPDSVNELAPLLPNLTSHLYEQDIHLRNTPLLAIQTLKPGVPEDAIADLVEALRKVNTTDYFGINLAQALALQRPDNGVVEDAIRGYCHRADFGEEQKASLLELVANPHLGEKITQEIVNTASTAPPGRLRNAAITACAKIRARAVNPIRGRLESIAEDPSEASHSRRTARQALNAVQAQ